MKNLLFIWLFSTSMFAQSFDKGNEFYRKGDYTAAVAQYENLLNSKKESAELYFNLANAYYKLNQVAPAIYNYEKALLLNPGDQEIANNLLFAQKMQIDDVQSVPQLGFHKRVSDFTSLFHYDVWAWIAIGCAFMVLAFFTGYYFSTATLYKRIYFIGMFVVMAPLLLSVAAALYQKRSYQQDRPAIVFAQRIGVKSEPSAAAPEAFVLHEGTKVFVLEDVDRYKKIAISGGNEGWIEQTAIKELK